MPETAVNPAAPASPEGPTYADIPKKGPSISMPLKDLQTHGGMAPDEDGGEATPGEDEAPRIPGKEAAPAAPKKAKYKVADRELELDEEVAAILKERDEVYEKRKEHTRAANEAFQNAAKERRENEAKYGKDALKQNPFRVFEMAAEAGIDPTQLVTEFAKQALAQQSMTPEQRAFADQNFALQQRQAEVTKAEEKLGQETRQREIQAFREHFAKVMPPLLQKHGLPDDEWTANAIGPRAAPLIRDGVAADDALEFAAEEYAAAVDDAVKRQLDRLSRTPGALVKKYPELAKRLREEDVASKVSPRLAVRPPPGTQMAPQDQVPQGPKTPSWADEEAEFRARRFGLKK